MELFLVSLERVVFPSVHIQGWLLDLVILLIELDVVSLRGEYFLIICFGEIKSTKLIRPTTFTLFIEVLLVVVSIQL